MQTRAYVSLFLTTALFAACGGSDDEEPQARASSFSGIAAAVQQPTGTVNEGTAPEVAEEFEKVSASAGAGLAPKQSQNVAINCTYGGDISVSAGSDGSGSYTYNNCCYTAASCCFNGSGTFYTSTGGGAYSQCYSYDLDYDCDPISSSVSYEGCLDSTGTMIFVVEVRGETFAVSGSYSSGSGTLTINGANGTFECTYSDGSGSCTGDGDFSF